MALVQERGLQNHHTHAQGLSSDVDHAVRIDVGADGDAGAHDDAGAGVVLVVVPEADGVGGVPIVAVQLTSHSWKKQQAFQVGEIPCETSCKQLPFQEACVRVLQKPCIVIRGKLTTA